MKYMVYEYVCRSLFKVIETDWPFTFFSCFYFSLLQSVIVLKENSKVKISMSQRSMIQITLLYISISITAVMTVMMCQMLTNRAENEFIRQ